MRTALLGYLAAVLLIVGVAFGAPAAVAHTAITATDPVADSALSTGPALVTGTFNEPLQPTFAAMTVVGPDGNLWSSGQAEVRDSKVSVAVRPLGPAGRYTVNYRVTSADGHVVTGSWSFTLIAPGSGQPGPAIEAPGPGGRIPLWPLVVGAAVLIAGAVVWRMRRRRT